MTVGMKRIDMQSYPRKAHFEYFNSMPNPYVGVTCNVDITGFAALTKAESRPFFLSFLYYAARAANVVPQLRQRISEGGIVEYDYCMTSHTVSKADGTYCYCQLDCRRPLAEFVHYARAAQDEARLQGDIDESELDTLPLLYVTTLPWLSYTALVQPTPTPADSNPRISWGGRFEQNGGIFMPVTLLCNHAVVDGRHIAQFYDNLNDMLPR